MVLERFKAEGIDVRVNTRAKAVRFVDNEKRLLVEKDGVEAELQQLLAARVTAMRDGLTLVTREYPTDIGPVDLLCIDENDQTVVVEVKRVGEIASVEQLLRYQERLDRDPRFAPTAGLLVAQQIKPQAKVYAESKGVAWVEIDLERLRSDVDPDLTLF